TCVPSGGRCRDATSPGGKGVRPCRVRAPGSSLALPREKKLATGRSKRGERTLSSGFGIGDERLECRHVAKRIELRPHGECRRHEVSSRDRLLQVFEAARVFPGVAP